MYICIPIDTDLGLKSPISLHFRGSSKFILVDPTTQTFKIFDRIKLPTETDAGQVRVLSRDYPISSVVVAGIGLDALAEFDDANMAVFSSTCDTVEEILDEHNEKRLTPISIGGKCSNGGGRGFGGGRCGAGGCGHC